MKALGVLGTSSSAGKTWITTALCAWLHREGVRVAPFKAQNMSNNAWVTLDGGEMARAQAVQAEACGLQPAVEMNPILLKPSSNTASQLIVLGRARAHLEGVDYYASHDELWRLIAETLDAWKSKCDVLVMEGAGSPVELNLMQRDLVNLRPIRHLDGRWLLIGDIDRGGVFAQLAGTWALLPVADRARGLGAIINRFRGDMGLFPGPLQWLAPHAPGLDILGTVPFRPDLRPEEEDGLPLADQDRGEGGTIAWVRFPHAANLTDCQPWWDDQGVRICWTADPALLASAQVIVLPGTKNTIGDLRWLRTQGLDQAILAAAKRGALIIGICGGYQMLGERLRDPDGVAGDAGVETGLNLLPVTTEFTLPKIVRHVTADCAGQRWTAYEIHLGRTSPTAPTDPLQTVWEGSVARAEGVRCGRVWGTYLHGWFESPRVRSLVCAAAGLTGHRPHPVMWAEKRQAIYTAMADHLVEHVNLGPVKNYLGI